MRQLKVGVAKSITNCAVYLIWRSWNIETTVIWYLLIINTHINVTCVITTNTQFTITPLSPKLRACFKNTVSQDLAVCVIYNVRGCCVYI